MNIKSTMTVDRVYLDISGSEAIVILSWINSMIELTGPPVAVCSLRDHLMDEIGLTKRDESP